MGYVILPGLPHSVGVGRSPCRSGTEYCSLAQDFERKMYIRVTEYYSIRSIIPLPSPVTAGQYLVCRFEDVCKTKKGPKKRKRKESKAFREESWENVGGCLTTTATTGRGEGYKTKIFLLNPLVLISPLPRRFYVFLLAPTLTFCRSQIMDGDLGLGRHYYPGSNVVLY